MENKITQDAANSSEVTQSFGVDKWQRKKSRYEFEDFIVSPPSQGDKGKFFELRYGTSNASKSSTYNKITQELKQDTHGTLAGSVMSYMGVDNRQGSRGDLGGAISMDSHGGLTFDDFSRHTDSPSSDIPYSTMPDLTLEAQLFPQADPLITLPWGRRHTLTPDDAAKIPSTILSPDYDSQERKISQAIKNLNITAKEVTYADITTQGCENITLDTSKMGHDHYLKKTEESSKRERKRSGLEEYVSSIAKPTNKSHYHIEEEEHDEEDEKEIKHRLSRETKKYSEEEHGEEDEKEIKRRLSRETKNYSEISSQDIEDTQQNRNASYDKQYSQHDNFNERCAEDQNNEILYETSNPLTSIEPSVINNIENKEKNPFFIDENLESSERENKFIAQETIKHKNEEANSRKTSKEDNKEANNPKDDLRNRKTSLLSLMSPFIPFKDSIAETKNPSTPITPKSKAVSGFFCSEETEEQKKSNTSEPDFLQASAQFQNTECNVSNDLVSSSKSKTRKRRPKPSALREMNVWGPSSM